MLENERVVWDDLQRCPYLPDRQARLPIRWPQDGISRVQLDQRLAAGDRRSGQFLYRTHCPGCQACEAIRVPVAEFYPRETQRRMKRRGDKFLALEINTPEASSEKVALFHRHKQDRGLAHGDDQTDDVEGYTSFLVDTCCDSLELSYYYEGHLVAVSIVDRGMKAMSAVYTYFDPQFKLLSLGTYSVLRQIELCREWKIDWLYLGYFVSACVHMNYKGLFTPHERLVGGQWKRFEEPPPRVPR